MKFIRNNVGSIIALLLLGVGVYVFNLRNPLFWDDTDWMNDNLVKNSVSHVLVR